MIYSNKKNQFTLVQKCRYSTYTHNSSIVSELVIEQIIKKKIFFNETQGEREREKCNKSFIIIQQLMKHS